MNKNLHKGDMGISLHSFIGSYLMFDSIYFDMDDLVDEEIIEVRKIAENIQPKLDVIKRYFNVEVIEGWIGTNYRVDGILKDKQFSRTFISEWKINFSYTSIRYRHKDLNQLLKYLRQLDHIDYGFLCYFTPLGDCLFYFTDVNNNVKVIDSNLNGAVLNRLNNQINRYSLSKS